MAKDIKQSWFKRHKVLTVILGLVVIGVIASAAGGGKSKPTTASNATPSKSKESVMAKIGEPANDGKFQFTVNSIKCGETQVGSEYLNKMAQGQYCRLNVTVKNIASGSQTLDSSSQYLYNAQNQKYSSDSTATIYAAPQNSTWFTDVNPGNTSTGDIVFDIPKDQTPVTAKLHDSAFSGGVKVSLQ